MPDTPPALTVRRSVRRLLRAPMRRLAGPAFPLKLASRRLGLALVALLVVGLQLPTHADAAGPLSLRDAHRAVWKMHNPDAVLEHYSFGTATFVGPRLAVTNYHVLDGVLNHTSYQDIALSQKGSARTLRIRRILAVSRTYDLALLETTVPGNGYLELASHRKTSLEHLTRLTLIGYPKASFRTMKQKERTRVLYESEWHYSIALEAPHHYRHKDSKGASGGPILNTQGKVMGVIARASYNLIFGVKLEHLRSLIRAGTGARQEPWWLTLCTKYRYLGDCLKAETESLRRLAERGHPIAQYRLWLLHEESAYGVSQLKKSADNGFAPSLLDLAYLLTDDTNSDDDENSDTKNAQAFHLAQQAAEQQLSTAQAELGKMLLEGAGTPKNKSLAIYWLEQAADQGLNRANKALNRP